MRITWLQDVAPRGRHVAVGEFDGVHLGHRQVIRGADTVVTFEPHPRAVVGSGTPPPLLTPLPVKADRIGALSVGELVVVPFDEVFARREAEEFVTEILCDRLGATTVSVGENFRFGHRARGDAELLRRHGGFHTRVSPLVELDGEIVSSSRIRRLVQAGDVAHANRLLGTAFELRGVVVGGDRRGRTLGYPTANIVPQAGIALPAHGVYACRAAVQIDGRWQSFTAATSVGVRPTFQTDRGVLVEAHLLDFSGDLYGRELRLSFSRRLRGEERFSSVAELVAQMDRDVELSRIATRESLNTPG